MMRAAIPLLALSLAACADSGGGAIHSAATAGVAAAIGAAGGPVVGLVLGLAAGYGIDQAVKYEERQIQFNVHDAIAAAGGPLDVGQAGEWQVSAYLPLTSRSGTVQVARSFGDAIPCKDIVFTVRDDDELYTATLCRSKDGAWRWASAEPNIHRWGALQ